jgi:uncharacterized membrane protein
MRRREDLATPRRRRRLSMRYDGEAFGQFSEYIARFLGTAQYLVIQSIIVLIWIALNVAFEFMRWDDYPFILLTLVLSLQASYAAPLILLAQNRQEDRDRKQSQRDRNVAIRTQEDAEYLARELAGVRLALADVATTDDLEEQVKKLTEAVHALSEKVELLTDNSNTGQLNQAGDD